MFFCRTLGRDPGVVLMLLAGLATQKDSPAVGNVETGGIGMRGRALLWLAAA